MRWHKEKWVEEPRVMRHPLDDELKPYGQMSTIYNIKGLERFPYDVRVRARDKRDSSSSSASEASSQCETQLQQEVQSLKTQLVIEKEAKGKLEDLVAQTREESVKIREESAQTRDNMNEL